MKPDRRRQWYFWTGPCAVFRAPAFTVFPPHFLHRTSGSSAFARSFPSGIFIPIYSYDMRALGVALLLIFAVVVGIAACLFEIHPTTGQPMHNASPDAAASMGRSEPTSSLSHPSITVASPSPQASGTGSAPLRFSRMACCGFAFVPHPVGSPERLGCCDYNRWPRLYRGS